MACRIFAAAIAACSFGHVVAEPLKEIAVVGYLPEWRYEGANWETLSEHLTHLLLFSLEIAPDGSLAAQDRIPRRELIQQAQEAAQRHGTRLMICFGGNGRSAGFSPMVSTKASLKRFLAQLGRLMLELKLDGVDYNWEYPGYQFGKGYLSEAEVKADYTGLARLVRATKKKWPSKAVTLAYYPDTRQEQLLKEYGIDQHVDLMHMMSYDAGGAQHSSWELGKKSVDQGAEVLPAAKLTMGVPFYGRHSKTGDWTTYEDLVQRHDPLSPSLDSVPAPGSKATIGFNGVEMIERKTRYAIEQGTGGVMIWEAGQDCRLVPVTHGDKTHVRTCPSDDSSLLLAITRAREAAGVARMRTAGWKGAGKQEL